MNRIIHPVAGAIAILTIATFWLSTALTELFGSKEAQHARWTQNERLAKASIGVIVRVFISPPGARQRQLDRRDRPGLDPTRL